MCPHLLAAIKWQSGLILSNATMAHLVAWATMQPTQ
jgi:hypothetical protein